MKILVTNHWLKKLGGSETFTYAMVAELKRLGHEVDLFTCQHGMVSDRIKADFSVDDLNMKDSYDLILANHHTCVRIVSDRGPVVQTCHGTTPKLEQPSVFADKYVAISEEVADHINKDIAPVKSYLIHNGIDCERFIPKKPLNKKVKRVLSLAHDQVFNDQLRTILNMHHIELFTLNKYKNPVWEVENHVNGVDMVVSLGRGAYEAMACGRPVLVMDKRPYQGAMGDGLITPNNVENLLLTNCSGRANRCEDINWLVETALADYSPELGEWSRTFALENLNIKYQIQKYLDLCKNL